MSYRQLIYLVAILLIGGAGYYFHTAGVPELIAKGSDDRRGNGVSAVEVFAGIYECNQESGCAYPIKIMLQQDTTLDIVASVDGEDVSLAQGTWGIGGGGSMVFIFAKASSTAPGTLIVNRINTVKLAGFSSKKGLLPGMENPVFTRIEDQTQSTVSN